VVDDVAINGRMEGSGLETIGHAWVYQACFEVRRGERRVPLYRDHRRSEVCKRRVELCEVDRSSERSIRQRLPIRFGLPVEAGRSNHTGNVMHI